MPPLLQRLTERKPETLDYLGVSYGLTPQLLRYVYLSRGLSVSVTAHNHPQVLETRRIYTAIPPTDAERADRRAHVRHGPRLELVCGERAGVAGRVRERCRHFASSSSCETAANEELYQDFRRRFLNLLSFKFREFGSVTALSVLEAANAGVKKLDEDPARALIASELSVLLSPFDLKRLDSYANNQLDYHVIMDLLPAVGQLYFERRLGADVRLSAVQSSILLALGLQRKTIEEVEAELSLPVSQALALFVKVVKKISRRLLDVQKEAISATIPDRRRADATTEAEEGASGKKKGAEFRPLETSLEEELEEAGDEAARALREKQRAMIDALDLTK